MGSLVVKIDETTHQKMQNRYHYSDVDVLGYNAPTVRNGTEVLGVPMQYDVNAVKMSIRNILMWRVGESVLRPEFGHKLHRSMYEQINAFNQDRVSEEIKRAIEENEPRAEVQAVSTKQVENDDGTDTNSLLVKVIYTVVGDQTDGVKMVEEALIR